MRKAGPEFTDAQAQKDFYRKGFAQLQLLNDAQTTQLINAYRKFETEHLAIDLPFISTSHSNNSELIGSVDQLILEAVEPEIHKHIPNARLLFSNFLVKRSGENTASAPHQDTTFVDESKSYSYSIWIALEDVTETNGCMKVLEGSHLFPVFIRSNPLNHWRYRSLTEQMEKDMRSVPMKKGEALVFAHSLIHGSFPNLTPSDRVAAVIACYPPDTQLWHYETSKTNETIAEQYAMTKEAFIAYVKGAAPASGKFVTQVSIDTSALSRISYHFFKFKARLQQQFN